MHFFAHHPYQDNSCAHSFIATRGFLLQHNMKTIPGTALSLDVHPIELLRDEVQGKFFPVHPRKVLSSAPKESSFQCTQGKFFPVHPRKVLSSAPKESSFQCTQGRKMQQIDMEPFSGYRTRFQQPLSITLFIPRSGVMHL